MPEHEPQFSKELLEKITTTEPIELLTDAERQRLHEFSQACQDAKLETEAMMRTLYLD